MREVRVNGKWPIQLPEHRAARPEWYTEEGWERARLDSMYRKIGSTDTVFYVGAEEGDMAALLAQWGAEMVLFEPNALVWPNIKAIWEANNLPTPRCFSGFASDVSTSQNLEYADWLSLVKKQFPESANGPVIGDHGFKELADPGDIPQIRIDDIPIVPTALSIDVEGSEWKVLRGAEQTLRKYQPKIWLSLHPEFMFHYFGEYANDLRAWIKAIGYKETFLDYQHEVHFLYEAL